MMKCIFICGIQCHGFFQYFLLVRVNSFDFFLIFGMTLELILWIALGPLDLPEGLIFLQGSFGLL